VNFEDLKVGMEVEIVIRDYRPEHWSEDMDKWQGEVVTIVDFDRSLSEGYDSVFIEEDEGAWEWASSDFEPYIVLLPSDPNIAYKVYKNDRLFMEMRKKYKVSPKNSS